MAIETEHNGFSEEIEQQTYQIVRVHERRHRRRIIERRLTRQQAEAHVNHPENNSKTATSEKAVKQTQVFGPWADIYEPEIRMSVIRRMAKERGMI